MVNIANNITELVGNTPLLRLQRVGAGSGAEILLKLEGFNPLGSVKDRIAVQMLRGAIERGDLVDGMEIVEPTSGNTGIGLAFAAASLGFSLTLTMPDSMSVERRYLLKALGAKIVLTPGAGGMRGAIDRADEIALEMGNAYVPGQFVNPDNVTAHILGTAQEILKDTDGQLDYFISGVGTGGTLTGVAIELAKAGLGTRIIAVEPEESDVLSGGSPGPHRIQGIGAGFVPDLLQSELIDEVQTVSAEEAAHIARRVAREEGVLIGISGGAALAVALAIGERKEAQGKRILVLIPDSGEKYISTGLFDDPAEAQAKEDTHGTLVKLSE